MKKHTSLLEKLFDKNYQLIDGTDEVFELDLALWEFEALSKKELYQTHLICSTFNPPPAEGLGEGK